MNELYFTRVEWEELSGWVSHRQDLGSPYAAIDVKKQKLTGVLRMCRGGSRRLKEMHN